MEKTHLCPLALESWIQFVVKEPLPFYFIFRWQWQRRNHPNNKNAINLFEDQESICREWWIQFIYFVLLLHLRVISDLICTLFDLLIEAIPWFLRAFLSRVQDQYQSQPILQRHLQQQELVLKRIIHLILLSLLFKDGEVCAMQIWRSNLRFWVNWR